MGKIKGQNFRVKLGGKYIAASTSCSLHIGTALEDASTKDSTGDWGEQECTGKSWDGSADALVVTGTDATGSQMADFTELIGTQVEVEFAITGGAQNRVPESGSVKYSGNAIISDINVTAGNKQNCTYSIQFQGVGALTKGSQS